MTAAELIDAAKAHAGLDDFGADSFREGLEVLTTALVEEGELSQVGRHVARGHLLRLLVNRLRIEDWY